MHAELDLDGRLCFWRREIGKEGFGGGRGIRTFLVKNCICVYIFEQEAHSAINFHIWAFIDCDVNQLPSLWEFHKLWNLQDLQKKPKYLVTFTVGIDQRNNINAAVKKVIKAAFPYFFLLYYFDIQDSDCWGVFFFFLLSCSFLRISWLCFFIMMVTQVNGINLSGPNVQSTLA